MIKREPTAAAVIECPAAKIMSICKNGHYKKRAVRRRWPKVKPRELVGDMPGDLETMDRASLPKPYRGHRMVVLLSCRTSDAGV
jgi:hypothetical protein